MQINQIEWDRLRKVDDTLQQIADAPRCEHGNIYPHVDEDEITVLSGERIELVWCKGLPKIAALFDALSKEPL